ncbi:hypothetical protein C8R45DRAFT_490039 [Mycena sanguinolenta]|nr:hypothetical protein C8R45DRAFT_490039 [Mycena sanguinolenta]
MVWGYRTLDLDNASPKLMRTDHEQSSHVLPPPLSIIPDPLYDPYNWSASLSSVPAFVSATLSGQSSPHLPPASLANHTNACSNCHASAEYSNSYLKTRNRRRKRRRSSSLAASPPLSPENLKRTRPINFDIHRPAKGSRKGSSSHTKISNSFTGGTGGAGGAGGIKGGNGGIGTGTVCNMNVFYIHPR